MKREKEKKSIFLKVIQKRKEIGLWILEKKM
jgi:hypothetical protein